MDSSSLHAIIVHLDHWVTPLRLHPVIDHFAIALLVFAFLSDLVGSLFKTRVWIKNMALTLAVCGAVAIAGSWWTGGLEANRIWDAVKDTPAKDLLHRHGEWGDRLAVIFGLLAVWRILIAAIGPVARSRSIYLLASFIAVLLLLLIQGRTGGELVYHYGVGTGIFQASVESTPSLPAVSAAPTPLPTVYVPPAPTVSATATVTQTSIATATTTSTQARPAASPHP